MDEWCVRSEMVIGEEGLSKLRSRAVAIFGLGGVGGYACEALCRSGIGELHLFDHDTFSVSNLNRQILATKDTIGKFKVDAARDRALSINPDIKVYAHNMFFLPENAAEVDFAAFDYVIDAIDTVTGKLKLIECAKEANVPIISCMGTGNKLKAQMLEIDDIMNTSVCPLAKVMRKELRARGIDSCKVVYSKEEPVKVHQSTPGSLVFVPAAAGILMAQEAIRDLLNQAVDMES